MRFRRGVTLLEILVVIVILSMLLGLGIGILRNSNKDLGVRAAAGRVVGILRAVHTQAHADASPAWVVIDTKENAVYAITKETKGMFHFEDTTGAFNQTINVKGPILGQGRVGLCYRFRSSHTIELPEIQTRNDNQGVAVEFWFYRIPGGGKHTLCTIGKDLDIHCDATGRVLARLGNLSINSDTYQVPRESWVYLQLIYNGREMKLFLNETEVRAVAGTTTWKTGPVILGATKDGLSGMIDEVRLSLILKGDMYSLPGQVEFEIVPPARAVNDELLIAFTPMGRLEPRHGAEIQLKIKSSADTRTITLNQQGLVQR